MGTGQRLNMLSLRLQSALQHCTEQDDLDSMAWLGDGIEAIRLAQDRLDSPLPCDVHLPPATVIRAGCSVSTLLLALEKRRQRE